LEPVYPMPKISYVNGRFINHRDAFVHIEDRGYQFADGVYEVIAIHNGLVLDEEQHMERLARSLASLRIDAPVSDASLKLIIQELLRRNKCQEGAIYLQITRGVAKRNHEFPKNVRPSLVMTLSKTPERHSMNNRTVGTAISLPDIRWERCDIKSISLLPNILAKQQAVEGKHTDAILVNDEGYVTEGSATNVYMVDSKGTILTHPANHSILGGITRDSVLKVARRNGLKVEERRFTLKELQNAREMFITSTTKGVMPIGMLDGKKIADGKTGPVTTQLQSLYDDYVEQKFNEAVA
jgi:D-alanine transaminase